jgi:16S rRNA C967 or C1407 C5-methylase (RsmB/RsmF family)
MLERLAPERGQTILDLAAGTGVAGFAAAGLVGREGHVIVSDFAEGMVDAAKRHAARLDFRTWSAASSTPSSWIYPTTPWTGSFVSLHCARVQMSCGRSSAPRKES